ncbi:MAG: type 4a pilus biogenesis protein PilO [Acidimicrobiales bacterium]
MKIKLIAITLAAVVAVTGIWYAMLWSPQGDKLDDAKAEQVAAEAQSAELETRLARLQRLEANKEELERNKELFAALIPDQDELDTFILDIFERAKASGIEFVSVAPAQPPLDSLAQAVGPVPVNLTMQVTGDYFAILRFLEQVRDGERLVTVDNLTMSAGGVNGLTASIAGRMFIRGTGVEAPVEAPAPTEGVA